MSEPALPSPPAPVQGGTLAFLFTDVEGSTSRWEQAPQAMQSALARHDGILRTAIAQSGGHVFKTLGDGFCAAFPNAAGALAAALAAQRALAADGFPDASGLKVRMAVDAGSVEARDGDYFGQPLNRVARLLAAGHGGQVLVSEIAVQLARKSLPAGAGLVSLGTHRLKDLVESQTIHQLVVSDLPSGFPRLRALAASPNNLPLQITSLIGRETEIVEIKALLGGSRLVTLVGSGGVGKTRLSLQVGGDLVDRYSDGVWLVELAPLSDPNLIAETITRLFGFPIGAGRDPVEAVIALLKEKQALLVLDNCEHLVGAVAMLAEAIVSNCPSITILASSREPLAIAGERIYRMPSLSFPDRTDGITAEDAQGYAAVRLFARRASEAVPGFAIANDNAPAVAEICRRLDGVALAIELAAPRLKMMRPQELASRLDDRFRILTGGSRTALPRQKTLRALIDWSYNLLSVAEQTLFQRLSVFAGGWTLESAATVVAGDPLEDWEVFDLLASLVDKSLVVADATGSQTRYRMLESTRQYAAEKLSEDSCGGWRRRLVEYLVTFYAEAAEAWPTAPTDVWLESYAPELDNLRAALEWAFGPDGEVFLGLDLVGQSMRVFWELSLFPELIRWVDAALARTDERTSPATAARLWLAKNFYIDSLGHRVAAVAALRAAELYRGLTDPRALGVALMRAGASLVRPRDTAEGGRLLREARSLLEPLGQSKYLGECLDLTGMYLEYTGDFAGGRRLLAEAAAMHRALGDRLGLLHALNNLAENEYTAGQAERAVELAREAVEIGTKAQDRPAVMLTRSNLAGYLLALGQVDEAAQVAKESLRDERSVGGRSNYIAWTTHHLVRIAAERGQLDRATRLLGYLDAWYVANKEFYRDFNEQVSYDRASALVEAAVAEPERVRLMGEGAAWTEDKAAEEALAI